MTASEPLTIEEEYEMQLSWKKDSKKCTFIVLASSSDETLNEVERAAGDVNLFFHDYDNPKNAEIEIMIAESKYKRKGFAREALKLMMDYGLRHLGVERYFAKIHESNDVSINLFKSLGYIEVNYVPAFQEYEFEYLIDSDSSILIHEAAAHAIHSEYIHEDVEHSIDNATENP